MFIHIFYTFKYCMLYLENCCICVWIFYAAYKILRLIYKWESKQSGGWMDEEMKDG